MPPFKIESKCAVGKADGNRSKGPTLGFFAFLSDRDSPSIYRLSSPNVLSFSLPLPYQDVTALGAGLRGIGTASDFGTFTYTYRSSSVGRAFGVSHSAQYYQRK
jgi:hypothetical protein